MVVAGSKRAFENGVPDSNAKNHLRCAMHESLIELDFQHPLNSPDRNLQQVIGSCDKCQGRLQRAHRETRKRSRTLAVSRGHL
jgi:hypothetical protein